jgi:hypothetical protein
MAMADTYEWSCGVCGVTTYVPAGGGPLACRCEWDPPLKPWENTERTREHSARQVIFRIADGRREYVGTAHDLESHRG